MALLSNRYRVLQQLGQGAYGETFLVEDTHLPSNRRCVLKQLKPATDRTLQQELIERFKEEAAILERLGEQSPLGQIPKLFAYFAEGGNFYLIQEWVEGQTLIERIRKTGRLSESEVVAMLVGLLPVLQYVHSKNIIHRDIKPSNIIFRRRDRLPVLIDFGIARGVIGAHEEATTRIGTPGYMPLEQAAGRPVLASDLFSLGMTAICALTGIGPKDLPTDPQTGAVKWQSFLSSVNPGLASVLDRATRMYFTERFASAVEMLQAVQAVTVSGGMPAVSGVVPTDFVPQDSIEQSFPPASGYSTSALQMAALVPPTDQPEAPTIVRAKRIIIPIFNSMVETLTGKGKRKNPPEAGVIPPAQPAGRIPVPDVPREFKNRLKMEFVLIRTGTFMMGSPETEAGRSRDERQQEVIISQPFYLGVYPVTQEEWKAVMGTAPSFFKGNTRLPVESIGWEEVQEFLKRLNKKERTSSYRLPTESEWEYACRAGTLGPYAGTLELMGWYIDNSSHRTHPVGQKLPNDWGLYDMHGNVRELCQNALGTDTTRTYRLSRGGSWADIAPFCRSAQSQVELPDCRTNRLGFRVLKEVG
ncbi:MAG: SUMF1/EgtB/PvdO family nonheme iron enzyme [Acidobacteria bacterium]|nr:SUMF1/EgtB/PvdO family nonheme iron enzyme [Acidobacteriota bacterium]